MGYYVLTAVSASIGGQLRKFLPGYLVTDPSEISILQTVNADLYPDSDPTMAVAAERCFAISKYRGANEDEMSRVMRLAVDQASRLKSKYLLAVGNRVHMSSDQYALSSLPVDASLSDAFATANALKAAMLDHATDVAAVTSDGAHQTVDTKKVSVLSVLPDLSSSNVLDDLFSMIEILDKTRTDHGSSIDPASGLRVHFNDDSAELTSAISYPAPALLSEAISSLNDLLALFAAHVARASE